MKESISHDPLNTTGVQIRIERIRMSPGTPTPRCDSATDCTREARFSCTIPEGTVSYRCDDHHPVLM